MWRKEGLECPFDETACEHEGIHAEGFRRPGPNVTSIVVRGLEENTHDVDAVQERVVVAQKEGRLTIFRTHDVRK